MDRKPEALRRGWPELPPWIFCSDAGTPLDPANVDKAFKRELKSAGLPLHFSPHGLRHTFASLLLQQGESPAYVQRQLGHASIQLTVDTYGRWLPMGNQAAVSTVRPWPLLGVSTRPAESARATRTVRRPRSRSSH
jgi:integrase